MKFKKPSIITKIDNNLFESKPIKYISRKGTIILSNIPAILKLKEFLNSYILFLVSLLKC